MCVLPNVGSLLMLLSVLGVSHGGENQSSSDEFSTNRTTSSLIPVTVTTLTGNYPSTKLNTDGAKRPPFNSANVSRPRPPMGPGGEGRRGPPGKPDSVLYDISEKIFQVASPVITLVGLVGNTMAKIILSRSSSLKKSPVSVFMIALACADSVVLLLDFVTKWIYSVFDFSLIHRIEWFCKAYHFLFVTAYTYAAWLVCAIALERCLVVWFPLKAKRFCTMKTSKIVVTVLPVVISILSLHHLFMWEHRRNRCVIRANFEEYQLKYGRWQVGVFYSWLPVVLLICCSAIIILQISRRNQQMQSMGTDKLITFRITITVLVVCITYAVLTIPLTITLATLANQQQPPSPNLAMVRTVVLVLGLSNHAINFFIYNLTLPKFNKEVRRLICCQRRPGSGTSVEDSNERNLRLNHSRRTDGSEHRNSTTVSTLSAE